MDHTLYGWEGSVAPIERIESLEDPRTADYRDIRDADLMGRRGLFMAEGRLVVRTLLTESRFRARSVLVTEPALESLRDALGAGADGPRVLLAEQALLNEIAGIDVHRGCLAAGERGAPLGVTAALQSAGRGPAMVVVMEELTNHDNVGGIFRNALAFGASAVLLGPRCCDPLYRKSIRVSMGAALRVPFAQAQEWSEIPAALRGAGFTTVALTPGPKSIDIDAFATGAGSARRVALLVGAEGPGLSADALREADARVRIAMARGVDSLNVATAAGIAMHRLAPGLATGTGESSPVE